MGEYAVANEALEQAKKSTLDRPKGTAEGRTAFLSYARSKMMTASPYSLSDNKKRFSSERVASMYFRSSVLRYPDFLNIRPLDIDYDVEDEKYELITKLEKRFSSDSFSIEDRSEYTLNQLRSMALAGILCGSLLAGALVSLTLVEITVSPLLFLGLALPSLGIVVANAINVLEVIRSHS